MLQERSDGCQDVLECAVNLIASWNLGSMGDDLASLVLDPIAPLEARKAAGYALAKVGTREARSRLLPLIEDHPEDSDSDLKGLALRCNWPDGLTVDELLQAITPPRARNYHGAYAGFLLMLDHERFDARGHRAAGLRWAKPFVRQDLDYDSAGRIARRIAIASLDEIDDPDIAAGIADLLLEAAESYGGSPLVPPSRYDWAGEEPEERTAMLDQRPSVRRKLLAALATRTAKDSKLWWAARETPGLLVPDDFPWLLERAVDSALPMPEREAYAELARIIPWDDRVDCIEAWLAAREIEPVASRFPYPLSMKLDSPEAVAAKKGFAEMKKRPRKSRQNKPRQAPAERVEQVLSLSETKDPRFFLYLCNELTLEEDSTHYGFERLLTKTPGWTAASPETQCRIVESAKRLLTTESDELERGRSEPLNSILFGYMQAIWLVMDRDPAWLDALPDSWWQRWTWYILRELRSDLMEAEQKPIAALLLRKVHDRATAELHAAVEELATRADFRPQDLLTPLLKLLGSIDDTVLDQRLCDRLAAGEIPDDRVGQVAEFVLSRNSSLGLPACVARIKPEAAAKAEQAAVCSAVALLDLRTVEGWKSVFDLLRRRPDLSQRILGQFSNPRNRRPRRDEDWSQTNFRQVGQLVAFFLEAFPPENDPKRGETSRGDQDDAARRTRDQLISWLGDQREVEAVEALKSLEQRFGGKYSWLRRPRAGGAIVSTVQLDTSPTADRGGAARSRGETSDPFGPRRRRRHRRRNRAVRPSASSR